jgi:hypothetical protein
MELLQKLRSFDADRLDLDEMIALSAGAKQVAAEYVATELEVPEWLADAQRTLASVIKARTSDMIAKELRETELALESLKSREERKGDLAQKAERLRARLGK